MLSGREGKNAIRAEEKLKTATATIIIIESATSTTTASNVDARSEASLRLFFTLIFAQWHIIVIIIIISVAQQQPDQCIMPVMVL